MTSLSSVTKINWYYTSEFATTNFAVYENYHFLQQTLPNSLEIRSLSQNK